MDLLRVDMRARGYALPTERTYLHWIKRFILFNQRRHPAAMGQAEIESFLNHIALVGTVAPATQRTALNALMYLYTKYLGREPPQLTFSYAKPTRRLPTVLSHEEAKATDQAVALRAHLVAGVPCPVCEQVVPRVAKVPAGSAVNS